MAAKKEVVLIPREREQLAEITVIGTGILVTHTMSSKQAGMMRDKKMQVAHEVRQACDPEQEFLDSMYWMTKKPGTKKEQLKAVPSAKFGVPAVAFKSATTRAAKGLKGIDMISARGMLFIKGIPSGNDYRGIDSWDLIEIKGGPPRMREDMVSLRGGGNDLRYRGEWTEWECVLPVSFNPDELSFEQIVNLINKGGRKAGVCEGRAQKSNLGWGGYKVKEEA